MIQDELRALYDQMSDEEKNERFSRTLPLQTMKHITLRMD